MDFRAPSGILFLKISFNLFISQRRGSFPVKYLQCLTEVTATRQNENESRTEARTVVTVGGRGPGLPMQGQSARAGGLLSLPLCSGFKAVAARAGSGSHLQNEMEDAGGMERGFSGASVTEWTPVKSPGCRHDGCCCWSRCRSSGGWNNWLPPATSSTCSSVERAEGCGCLSVCREAHPGLSGAPTACSKLTLGPQGSRKAVDNSTEHRVQIPAPLLTCRMSLRGYSVLSCGISLLVKPKY